MCCIVSLSCTPLPLHPDAPPLLAFKTAILSDPLRLLSTWNNLTNCTSPCSWAAIRCKSHRVVALQLSASQLTGTLSPSLGRLPFLRSLDLSANKLSGGIPRELGQSMSLAFLNLSNNKLKGSIPAELGQLAELQHLVLYSNELSGGVPAALGNCSSLTGIGLNQNSLSGSIPVELGALHQLQILALDDNELSGGVPATLANCSSLTDLGLDRNSLSGSIPVELGALHQVQGFYLWGNKLSGGVPATLGNLSSVTDLELSQNSLSGSIPVELGALHQLQFLYLGQNKLSGGVPATLGNCSSLTYLELSLNSLSGSIPAELGRLNNLIDLKLANNHFMEALPGTLANCTNLTVLQVAANQLSGPISNEFCSSWSSLGVLELADNLFSGRIPPCLIRLEKLFVIRLQRNAFVGTIPPFSNVRFNYLNLSTNNLSGSIPESLGDLQGLVSLDLSNNFLSGQVPSSLGSLQHLTILNLSKNALSANIPSALGSCVELTILSLSHNKLTGNIPVSFGNLRSLTKLDLADNQLAGDVPNTWPYNKKGIVDLSENSMLCGLIVNRTCNTSNQMSLLRASSNLKRTVSIVLSVVIVVLLMLGLVIWRHRNLVGCDSNIYHDNRPSDDLGRKAMAVSADELREATDGFSEPNLIGESGTSIVYKAILVDGMIVAVKVLKSELFMGMITEAEVARLKREVKLLAMVRHRNIVRVLGCCFNMEMQAIVLELVPNGNLDHYLHGMERQDAITKNEKLRLLRGIAEGLEYLHHWHDPRKRIVHCDLKPANILLDEQWDPLIADFGIAKLLQQGKDIIEQSASLSSLLRGSIGYIPPEYASTAQVSCAGDVYSFGVVMLEILTGRRPTEAGGEQETLMSLVRAAYPDQLLGLCKTPGMTSYEIVALAQLGLSCTSHVPKDRPTMQQVARALTTIANLSSGPWLYPTLYELLS